jgi:hypothetical protein
MANVFSRDCCARSKGTLIQGQIEHLMNLVVVMIASRKVPSGTPFSRVGFAKGVVSIDKKPIQIGPDGAVVR